MARQRAALGATPDLGPRAGSRSRLRELNARALSKPRVAAVTILYLTLCGALVWWWLEASDPARATGSLALHGTAVVCLLPALLGALVLGLHSGTAEQYLAKATARFLLPPVLLLFWAAEKASGEAPVWPYLVAFAGGHVGAFVLFALWAAVATTRVGPARGTAPESARALAARLRSLPATGPRCTVADGDAPDELVVDFAFPDDARRSHRFVLTLDEARRTVHAIEQEGSGGGAARDDAEADMRPPGTVGIDPTRPRARKVHGTARLATFLEPERLAAVPIRVAGSRAELPAPWAHEVEAKDLAYGLGALVTRSGWTFPPVLFGFQRRVR